MRDRLREDYRWTPRQREVLDLMARGKTNTDIAEALGISLAGAKWHVSEILSKLHSDSREEAAEYWRHYNGLAPRFARVFRGLALSSSLRWAAVAAVAVGAGLVLVLVAFSLDGGDDQQATPDRTTTATSTPTATATARPTPPPTTTPTLRTYPADTRTNIPEVDAVIEAVLAGDVAALKSLMYFASIPCGNEVPPWIACEGDEARGTLVEAFLMADCRAMWRRPAEVEDVLRQMVDGDPDLYAVYFADETMGSLPPFGHGVVFMAPDHRGRTVRVTEEEGIIALFLGCETDPRWALWKHPDLVLPPLGEP